MGGALTSDQNFEANKLILGFQDEKSIQRENSAPRFGSRRVRLYSKIIQDFEDKYYRKKITPNKFNQTPEELYEENMTLKHKFNQLEQHIVLQKTQNKMLNNELEK